MQTYLELKIESMNMITSVFAIVYFDYFKKTVGNIAVTCESCVPYKTQTPVDGQPSSSGRCSRIRKNMKPLLGFRPWRGFSIWIHLLLMF